MSGQRYTPEFKDEAVKQVIDRGYTPSLRYRSDLAFRPTVFTSGSRGKAHRDRAAKK